MTIKLDTKDLLGFRLVDKIDQSAATTSSKVGGKPRNAPMAMSSKIGSKIGAKAGDKVV